MKTVIVGCGRVGSILADSFDRAGHEVIIIDTSTAAFDRLPSAFRGTAIRGDGTDEDTLRRAGAEDADIFMAMTEGDNRNVMTSQLAVEALGARQVIAKVNDPLRARAYADLGLATLCRTNLMATAVNEFLGLDLKFGPGLSGPTGTHPGGEHHGVESAGSGSTVAAGAASSAPAGSPSPGPSSLISPSTAASSANGFVPTPMASTTAREG